MATEKLFEIWGKRNPEFETRYEENIIRMFSDYGKGSTGYQESRGKIFGAGYEVYLMAYFIGLYFDKRRPLIEDKNKRKSLGQALQFWGNQENRKLRKSYGKIREYVFISLVARSEVDYVELDKDKLSVRKVVDTLIETMEEYANYGFYYMEDKLIDNPDFFFRNAAFLELFLSFGDKDSLSNTNIEVAEAESLD